MHLRKYASCAWLLLSLISVSCMSSSPLVRLADIDPSIEQDPKYAGSDNFMGRPIRSYEVSEVWLTKEAAEALKRAQDKAVKMGFGILVYDGYRPQSAVDHFVEWGADLSDSLNKAVYYPEVPKEELFDRGYISAKSGHSRGSTVDLTLMEDGIPIEMGTPFDYFDDLSHTMNPEISGMARVNRNTLLAIMEEAGFTNYVNEWWHFTLKDEPYPDTYFDIPIK